METLEATSERKTLEVPAVTDQQLLDEYDSHHDGQTQPMACDRCLLPIGLSSVEGGCTCRGVA